MAASLELAILDSSFPPGSARGLSLAQFSDWPVEGQTDAFAQGERTSCASG